MSNETTQFKDRVLGINIQDDVGYYGFATLDIDDSEIYAEFIQYMDDVDVRIITVNFEDGEEILQGTQLYNDIVDLIYKELTK